MDTKEKILVIALRLFAQKGFEAVSVSLIAGELGMTKGALYKHYKNKQDIFDSIVERMYYKDKQQAKEFAMPEDTFAAMPPKYRSVSIESLKSFSEEQFNFWTVDEFASNFRKMLTLEQYRNPKIAELYQSCICAGAVSYTEDLFREMISQGLLKQSDPKLLAIEFYSPLYLLISISDVSPDKKSAKDLLSIHIDNFIQRYAIKRCGGGSAV
ncbi:MAG: TetR/AcrR family transcriptional regulator [Oscillospiraceae bacterium]